MSVDVEDMLRRAFARRAGSTEVTGASLDLDGPAPATHLVWVTDRPRRRMPWLALAAAAAVVLATTTAVVWRLARDTSTPASAPAAPAPWRVIDDPLAISLDDVGPVPAASAAQPPRPYVVLDVGALPTDWTVDEDWSGPTIDGEGELSDEYRYSATLTTPTGERYHLMLGRRMPATPDATAVLVGGAPGQLGEQTLTWPAGADATAMLSTNDETATATASLVGIAEALAFTTTDTIPAPEQPDSTDPNEPGPGADMAGTLDGAAWWAEVTGGSQPEMTVHTSAASGGGFGVDRSSQPSDDPAGDTQLTIVGVPGHGAMAIGFFPLDAHRVRAVVDGSIVADLPLVERAGVAFYAVPVPDGIAVDQLVAVDASGAAVATVEVPPIPRNLDGTTRIIDAG